MMRVMTPWRRFSERLLGCFCGFVPFVRVDFIPSGCLYNIFLIPRVPLTSDGFVNFENRGGSRYLINVHKQKTRARWKERLVKTTIQSTKCGRIYRRYIQKKNKHLLTSNTKYGSPTHVQLLLSSSQRNCDRKGTFSSSSVLKSSLRCHVDRP